MAYLDVVIETDPVELADDAKTDLQSRLPGWEPNPGTLADALLDEGGEIASEVRDVAADMPAAAFRSLGEKLFGVPPDDATSASADSTWTLVDDDGHTIPAGTQVALEDANGDLVGFQTVEDVTVAATDTATAAGEVLLVALEPGAAASGLTGTPQLLDALDFVESIALVSQTTGGQDAEEDDDYANRLSDELQLLAPRPIIPSDFETLLLTRIDGIERALAVDGWIPGVNEKDTISKSGTLSGGSYSITVNGQSTGNTIAYNASAATITTALEALSNVNPNDVIVTGGPVSTTPVVIEFVGQFLQTAVTVSVGQGTLSGGGTIAVVETQTATGGFDQERAIGIAVADDTGGTVSGGIKTDAETLLAALREVNFLVDVVDFTYTTIDITWVGVASTDADPASVEAAGDAAVSDYLNPASFPAASGDTVYVNELIALLDSVEGMERVTSVTLARSGQSLAAANVTLAGTAARPQAGTIDGTVT